MKEKKEAEINKHKRRVTFQSISFKNINVASNDEYKNIQRQWENCNFFEKFQKFIDFHFKMFYNILKIMMKNLKNVKKATMTKEKVKNLQDEIVALIQTAETIIEKHVAKIHELEKNKKKLKTTVKILQKTSFATPNETAVQSQKFSDSKKFDKGNFFEYVQWEKLIRKKLKHNNDRFFSKKSKMNYINFRITEQTTNYMKNFLQKNDLIVDDFLKKMAKRFGNLYAQKTARDNYRKLTQKRKLWLAFLRDFHR